MEFKKGNAMQILFFGDSIIEGSYGVSFLEKVRKTLTNPAIEIIVKGQMGDTCYDLMQRLQRDVLDIKPQYVFMHIGINDLMTYVSNQKHQRMDKWTEFISPDLFGDKIRQVVKSMLQANIKVVTLLPGGIEGKENQTLNKKLDLYIQELTKISRELDVPLIDFRSCFMKSLAMYPGESSYKFNLSNVTRDMGKIFTQYPPDKVVRDPKLQEDYYSHLTDIASQRDLHLTFDGAHFTSKGAQILAEQIAAYIREQIVA